jgi:hypothetical protein
MEAMINSLCSESLIELTLNIITPETVKVVKESCPNIKFLRIKIHSEQFLDLIIPPVCELPLLETLCIETSDKVDGNVLVKILGDHLASVEYLLLDFPIDLSSFKYFTKNCKADLKKWIVFAYETVREDFLKCVGNFQEIHNSLEVFGITYGDWTIRESEIINSLKGQGVDVVSHTHSGSFYR